MKAFILCGGKGTRLRPYTYKLPKPMLPLGGKPILEHMLEHLKAEGITDITLFTGYLKETIRGYFGDGRKFGLKLTYVEEEEGRGTAGAILHAERPKEAFLLTMGDHLSDFSMKGMVASHRKSGCAATMAVLDFETQIEYGVVRISPDGKVKSFEEKPLLKHSINTGIYLLEPEIFNFIREKEDFAKDVFPRLLESGGCINTYTLTGYWHDIGNIEDYKRMNEKLGSKG